MANRVLLDQVIGICKEAGSAIMDIYNQEDFFEVQHKQDESPLTAADLAAHRVLVSHLEGLLEDAPVLSEEGELPDFSLRSQWQRYWIIDPLDGTKEFVKRSGEFTVNVALIENGVPVLGVVYVPVQDLVYAGGVNCGAIKQEGGQETPIRARTMQGRDEVTVVASRNHGADEVVSLMDAIGGRLGKVTTTNMGSSLKLCLVAEGVADLYPRLAPTCEWDTAAAQAVVEAAGGEVVDLAFQPLRYNAKAEILNPYFYVLGDTSFD